jgi:hypothetical protein
MSKRVIGLRHTDDRWIHSEHLAELGGRLRPLEELEGERPTTGPLEGAIRVDERVPVPNGIVEPESRHGLGFEKVVIIIAILMLGFIAFITWQISLMPGPGKP